MEHRAHLLQRWTFFQLAAWLLIGSLIFLSGMAIILKVDSSGTPTTFASDWLSPDQQWQYKCCDGLGIVEAAQPKFCWIFGSAIVV